MKENNWREVGTKEKKPGQLNYNWQLKDEKR